MANEFLTIEAKLDASDALVASLSAEKAEMQKAFEALASEKVAAITEANASAEAIKAQALEAELKITALEAEKADLAKKLEDALANQITSTKEAAKIVSSLGVKPLAISPALEAEAKAQDAITAKEVLTQFSQLKAGSMEKHQFFMKHKAILAPYAK